MRDEAMAQKFSEVTQAQEEESSLLLEVTDIFNAMKNLNRDRGTAIAGLSQAHMAKIEELKREHAHQVCLMRTQRNQELKATEYRETEYKNALRTKNEQINSSRSETTFERSQNQLLEAQLAETSAALVNARLQTAFDQDMQKAFCHQALEIGHLRCELQEKTEKTAELQSKETEGAIVKALDKEIGAHAEALETQRRADHFIKDHEFKRLEQHRRAYDTHRKALKTHLDCIKRDIVLESPFDPAAVLETMDVQQKGLIRDMEDTIHWLDTTMKDLVSEKSVLMQYTENHSQENLEERKTRIEKMFELSDHCNVRAKLEWCQEHGS